MCLSSITKVKILEKDTIIYKVVSSELKPIFHDKVWDKNSNCTKIQFKIGKEIKSIKRKIFFTPFDSYQAGFHAFLSLRNAKLYSEKGQKILKCKIPKGTEVTIGEQTLYNYRHKKFPCIVTPILTPLKEVS